ncbi:hypothetical protein GCM10027080_02040 [Pedococcus soli]
MRREADLAHVEVAPNGSVDVGPRRREDHHRGIPDLTGPLAGHDDAVGGVLQPHVVGLAERGSVGQRRVDRRDLRTGRVPERVDDGGGQQLGMARGRLPGQVATR